MWCHLQFLTIFFWGRYNQRWIFDFSLGRLHCCFHLWSTGPTEEWRAESVRWNGLGHVLNGPDLYHSKPVQTSAGTFWEDTIVKGKLTWLGVFGFQFTCLFLFFILTFFNEYLMGSIWVKCLTCPFFFF